MALQAQQQATPSPTRDRAGSGEWLADTEKLPGAAASPEDVVVASTHHAAAAARYVPPRATSHTAEPNPGRGGGGGWYSWNGGRRARHDPPAPRRQQPAKTPPPAPPLPAAPPPPPAASPAPAPRAPPPHAQVRSADRVVPAILSRKRRAAVMQRAALLARAAAAGLCLAALAVLASDTRRGWARDSYSNYAQFRYSEAVNVVGFLYSVFQFVALAELMRRNKHLIPHPKRDLFDFTMDQVVAYLLISSSSSATARASDLIENWGSDSFPSMANGSIAISFVAFVVFAICSLISAYNLFRRDM
ncbi:CASP-like protein 4A1 [Zea mays]|uniref:CASP-like protein 4A2 n=2 Tax=Zea mays TaxID=4577 RepID=CSPLE_MAIZE|nr:CASP-like protein 4A1 [Zea mays]C4JAF2.1 RecName: Full=CASP-like protein 4A2; Short=ZmCASPL4A2 [Zea mays]ACR38152.1 unknown [Zea mays]AQK68244.1 CASP-like protein 14 [Zea mays]|eukprot:NP_001183730.1 CASP-like protein 4A1 [Zea mays]